jgi:hypothetical protein
MKLCDAQSQQLVHSPLFSQVLASTSYCSWQTYILWQTSLTDKRKETDILLTNSVIILTPLTKHQQFRDTGCPALNVNQIKYYIYSSIKCTWEIDTLSSSGLHKASYVLRRFQNGHHLWHDTQEDDIRFFTGYWCSNGNALCSSNNSVMQLIYIFHFFTINNVYYKLTGE